MPDNSDSIALRRRRTGQRCSVAPITGKQAVWTVAVRYSFIVERNSIDRYAAGSPEGPDFSEQIWCSLGAHAYCAPAAGRVHAWDPESRNRQESEHGFQSAVYLAPAV